MLASPRASLLLPFAALCLSLNLLHGCTEPNPAAGGPCGLESCGAQTTSGDDSMPTSAGGASSASEGTSTTRAGDTTGPGGTPTTDRGQTAGADTQTPETTRGYGFECDDPCPVGERCFVGHCVPDRNGEGSGGMAMECGGNVMFATPECTSCAQASCCAELQACFGDETRQKETPCLVLNDCIAMNCQRETTLDGLQTCAQANCSETVGELETWLGFNACMGMNCQGVC